jgi:hypothetical protein
MHKKLDLLEGRHSGGAGLPDKKPVVHSAWATAQLDELLAARDGALNIWDVASGTGNAGSGTTDMELTSVHDSKMGL